jgi:ubiquinone/menaquinone biosynthesis C-methylase UbiE
MSKETPCEIFARRLIVKRPVPTKPNGIEYYSGEGSNYPRSYLDPESSHRYRFWDMGDWIARKLPGEANILDVGGALGHLSYWMKRRHPGIKVINSDYSVEALKRGRENGVDSPVGLSADRLPFKKEAFEGIVFGDVLEHLTPRQAEASLKETMRVLVPGGMVFINIPNKDTWTKIAFEEPTHLWIPGIKDMVDSLKVLGFEEINSSTRGFPFSFGLRKVIDRDIHLPFLGTSIFVSARKPKE